jgi:nucleoside-diphosphate-sugar epimerase
MAFPTDAASAGLVLLTGASGHLGFRTLVQALTEGYTVRAAVRSQAKAKLITSHPLVQAINPPPGHRLSFVMVPDLTASAAYDEAAKDVSYIIHIASPLMITGGEEIALNEQDAYFIQPAVRGTLNILEAAQKSGSVKRVVITSSLVALVPLDQLTGAETRPVDQPVLPTDRIEFIPGPYENEFEAYAASKVAALHEAEMWMAQQPNPGFDMIHLHPSYVEGRNELASSPREALKGTNGLLLGLVLGKHFEGSIANATVHNDDVARIHVEALKPWVPGNQSYILSQKTRWNDALEIVKREFPEAVQKRTLPNCGSHQSHNIEIDASWTEDVFGFKHQGFEEQIKSVVGHYLELRLRSKRAFRAASQDRRGLSTSLSVRANA